MSKLPESLATKLSAKESSNFTSDDSMMKEYVNHHYAGGLAAKEVSKIRVDLTELLHSLERRKKGIDQQQSTSSSGNNNNGLLDPVITAEDAAVGSEEERKEEFMKKLKLLEIDLKFVVDDAARLMEKKM